METDWVMAHLGCRRRGDPDEHPCGRSGPGHRRRRARL